MSLISQIGVVILIVFIVLVLIRSNKNLKNVSEEGEDFVDEWARRQEKKEELRLMREQKKLEAQEEKERRRAEKRGRKRGNQEENTDIYEEDTDIYEENTNIYKEDRDIYEENTDIYKEDTDIYGEDTGVYKEDTDLYSEDEALLYERQSCDELPESRDFRVNDDWLYNYEKEEEERQARVVSESRQEERDGDGKIVPMKKRQVTGITLMKLDGNHRVMGRYRVNKIPFNIGRNSGNDLVLDDLCVARNHCRIVEQDGRYILEDTGTMNKLYVNGMVTGRVPLSDGLRIYIGNEEFQVEMESGRRGQPTRLYQNVEAGSYE